MAKWSRDAIEESERLARWVRVVLLALVVGLFGARPARAQNEARAQWNSLVPEGSRRRF